MTRLGQTPSQTLGPFFHQGLMRVRRMFQLPGLCTDDADLIGNVLVDEATPGERLRVEGTVYDGGGKPVPDALIEIWQADAQGVYRVGRAAGPGSAPWGFGRAPTEASGSYFFETIKPGRIAAPSGAPHAPHLNVIVGARGMARHAFTRIYFAGDAELESDPVLACVPRERRATLIAAPVGGSAASLPTYRFDVRLQGERETVFFDL